MIKPMPLSIERTKGTKAPSLRELTEIEVDPSLPPAVRIHQFITDIRNAYHFTVNGNDVRIGFSGTNRLTTQIACVLSNMDKQDGYRTRQSVITLSDLKGSTVA